MGNNPSRVTAQDKAILDLKNQRDKLHQYQKRITVLTDRETQIAKQMLAQGDKKRALLALRRKKYQESLLSKTDGQLEQLEKLTSSVEFALIQKDVLFGLQQGTKVLKEIHTEMGGIEHVEKLMGETADAIAYQKVCWAFHGGVVVELAMLIVYRKSTRCSAERYPTRTKRRWKMSSKLWRQRYWARSRRPRYPMLLCRMSPTRNLNEKERRWDNSRRGYRRRNGKRCMHDDLRHYNLKNTALN